MGHSGTSQPRLVMISRLPYLLIDYFLCVLPRHAGSSDQSERRYSQLGYALRSCSAAPCVRGGIRRYVIPLRAFSIHY